MAEAGGVEAESKSPDAAADSAARVGAELVALFDRVGARPDRLQWLHRHVAAHLCGTPDPTLDRAFAAVAAAIDAQAPVFDRNPYHNRQHFCEVVLTAHALCALERLDAATTQFLLLAALIHDFVHDGGSHPAFLQERASIECVRPLLQSAGLQPLQLSRMATLVLSTDTAQGTGFMAAACKAHEKGEACSAKVPAGAPELAALTEDAGLAMLARMLCEADILPSIGLDLAHGMLVQERLAREWRRPLDAKDKLAFVCLVLQQGYVSDFFLPNVQLMRAALTEGSHASEQG
ncbi:hypothetical protein [Roseateles sp.]|uniref:hypothetical protein n=1 Tax=Roseateles sp. TaxID=1971397 RepID=UPI00286A5F4F|nr:hypothetical protein [Roseateles sp.]